MNAIKYLAIGLMAAALTCNTGFSATTSELLQQGLYAEEVDGNLSAAIETYGQVIANPSAPQNQIAQALYRQGMCYLKLKDDASARMALEKLVTQYSTQTDLVEKARPVLEDLTNFDPATLMPAGTLAYVELGSPGRQIETILTMLKGTPFENPLAAMGGQPPNQNGQKSPADFMGALLNPSMVAEFKKIRGLAIGVTGIAQNHPPTIAVLYPGKSDALRGLLLAGIGMVGKTTESIEGMQTVNIDGTGAVAYDDKVIIFAQPAELLRWSVKQYKGLNAEPTLVSGNKSFARIGKAQRQKNALTVWGDVDGLYARLITMFPNGKLPKEVLSANAICDFANIHEFILTHSLETNASGTSAEIEFKEGHHCLAYDLVRTPPITKASMAAVPSEAIAVASFSLNSTDGAQAEKLRSQVQNVTGLDVGRELFANIEQVTLFVLPAEGTVIQKAKPEVILSRAGLVITSRNPEKTRQLLDTVLGTVSTLSGGKGVTQPGQYQIGANGGQGKYCYLEQVNGTTLLSLNQKVLNASIAALRGRKSITASGPLSGAVSQMGAATSKLLLVSVGGAMRLMGPQENLSGLNEEQVKQFNHAFSQLARSTDSALVEFRTDEQMNHLALNSSLTGIPPLNELIGPITEMSRLSGEARVVAEAKQARLSKPAVVGRASAAPVIDGAEDETWSAASVCKLENVVYDPPGSARDLAAEFRTLWDEQNLYVLVNVTDDKLSHDTAPDRWFESDGVEIYLDATNQKSTEYGDTDYQYAFNWDKTTPELRELKHSRTNGVQYAFATTETGYRLEVKFPWSTLGTKPSAGATVGLDVEINDNDGGGRRESKVAWHDPADGAWNNPQMFGNAELAGLIGWWKFDEKEGATAGDSSGGNHNGTFVGNVKWSNGKSGGGIDLDGRGSFVRIGSDSAFDISGEITLASWVNIRSVPVDWMAIVTKGDSAWRMSTFRQEQKSHFVVNNSCSEILGGTTTINPNEWHHLAAVYDGEVMKLYVDGKLDGTQVWKGGIAKNNAEVLIGENVEQPNRCFDGQLDDVRIYNYALGESQIKALAAASDKVSH